MKRHVKNWIGIILSLLCLMMTTGVYGQEKPVTQDLFDTAQKLDSPKSSTSYWFYVPPTMNVKEGSYVKLHISYSKTLISRLSSMGVSINGTPLDTKWINEVVEPDGGWWRLAIPSNLIKTNGPNQILIQSNHRSIEGECADIDNMNNWVMIHPNSYIALQLEQSPGVTLDQYYSTYYDSVMKSNRLETEFVLPNKVVQQDVKTMLTLAGSIGTLYKGRKVVDYEVHNIEKMGSTKNKVFIGPREVFGKNGMTLPAVPLKVEEGYLSITDSTPQYPYYKLLITGADLKGREKALQWISRESILSQVQKPFVHIQSSLAAIDVPSIYNEEETYTFRDLGYDDINLAGPFEQKTMLKFTSLGGVKVEQGAYIELKFRHADTLVSEKSQLSVLVNGTPVGSVKLGKGNAEEGTMKVMIPQQALNKPYIEVEIKSYNDIGKIDCSKDYSGSAWTVIDASSKICLKSSRNGITPSLEHFPYFYPSKESSQIQVVCQLPQIENTQLLGALTVLATRAAQNTSQSIDFEYVAMGDKLTDKASRKNRVLMGSYADIKLPKEIEEILPVVPRGDSSFTIKEGVEIVPETLLGKSIVQVVRSPWEFDKLVYVVMYDTPQSLTELTKALNQSEILWQLKKQVAIIGEKGKVHTFKVEEKNTLAPLTPQELRRQVEEERNMPWWVFVGGISAVLIGIGLLIRLMLRKKKKKKGHKH